MRDSITGATDATRILIAELSTRLDTICPEMERALNAVSLSANVITGIAVTLGLAVIFTYVHERFGLAATLASLGITSTLLGCIGASNGTAHYLKTATEYIVSKLTRPHHQVGNEYIAPMCIALGFGLVFLTGALPKQRSFENMFKRVDNMAKGSRGAMQLADMATPALSVLEEAYRDFVGLPPKTPTTDVVSDWVNEWTAFISNTNLERDMNVQRPTLVRFYQLYVTHTDLMRRLREFSIGEKEHLSKFTSSVVHWFRVANSSPVGHSLLREVPLTLLLTGESGVGKTNITNILAMDIFREELSLYNDENPIAGIYTRNTEQEYWDGYRDQAIIVADDAFQIKDSPTKPDPLIFEIIRMTNVWPYALHMADISQKQNTTLQAKGVILTSNFLPDISSIRCPAAFMRRIHVTARVLLKPRFVQNGRMNMEEVRRATPPGVRINKDIYDFEVFSCQQHHDLPAPRVLHRFEYRSFVEFCREKKNQLKDESGGTAAYALEYYRNGGMWAQEPVTIPQTRWPAREPDFEDAQQELPAAELHPQEPASRYTVNENRVAAYLHDQVDRFCTERGVRAEHQVGAPYFWPFYQGTHEAALTNADVLDNEPPENAPEEVDNTAVDLRTMVDVATEALEEEYILSLLDDEAGYEGRSSRDETGKTWFTRIFPDRVKQYLVYCRDQTIKIETIVYQRPGVALTVAALSLGLTMMGLYKITTLFRKDEDREQEVVDRITWRSEIPTLENGPITNQCMTRVKYRVPAGQHSGTAGERTFKPHNTVVHPRAHSGEQSTKKPANVIVRRQHAMEHTLPLALIEDEEKQPEEEGYKDLSPDFPVPSYSLHDIALRYNCPDTNTDRLLEMLKNHLYTLEVYDGNTRIGRAGSAMAVVGHALLLNGHVRTAILAHCEKPGIRILMRSHALNLGLYIDAEDLVDAVRVGVDAFVLLLPRHFNQARDITKHFIDYPSAGKFQRSAGVKVSISIKPKNNYTYYIRDLPQVAPMTEDLIIETKIYDCDAVGETVQVRPMYRYNGSFERGECGEPILLKNPSISGKIVGIHMAGTHQQGFASAVYREDLVDGIKKLHDRATLPRCRSGIVLQGGLIDETLLRDDPVTDSDRIPGEFVHLAYARVVVAPVETKLEPSLLAGSVRPQITRPAVLKRTKTPHGTVDPLYKAIGKNGGQDLDVPQDDLDMVSQDLVSLYCLQGYQQPSEVPDTLVLPFETAVAGIHGNHYYPAIARSTSAGFPWVFDTKIKGKTKWFGGADEIDFSRPAVKQVREAVNYRLEQAAQGNRTPTLWIDTCKDERRLHAKVDELKTRQFVCGPMDFNIACLQYFGAFRAHLTENRIDNEIAIGINPFSMEWQKLASHLSRHGDQVVAGDFSSYDGNTKAQLLLADLTIIEEWYKRNTKDYRKEHALIRYVLFSEISNSVHLVYGVVYNLTHSLPSGCVITSHLNSINNSLLMRLAWLRITRKYAPTLATMADFRKEVSMCSYGDDNVLNVSGKVASFFNQETMTTALADYQTPYTDETKSATVHITRKLKDVQFIKRGFRYDPDLGRHTAPLQEDVCYEMVNWIRKSADPIKATLDNLEQATTEIAYHGRTAYEEFVRTHRLALQLRDLPFVFPTYAEHRVAHSQCRPFSEKARFF